MAPSIQVSYSIPLTDYKTGEAFYLSSTQIIYFTTNTNGIVDIIYTDNRDNIFSRLVAEDEYYINGAAPRTFGVILENEKVVYIDADKVIFLDINRDLELFTITYDSKKEYPDSLVIYDFASPPTLENIFAATPVNSLTERYLNNLFVNSITPKVLGEGELSTLGSEIMYDSKGTENFTFIAQESPEYISDLINSLASGPFFGSIVEPSLNTGSSLETRSSFFLDLFKKKPNDVNVVRTKLS